MKCIKCGSEVPDRAKFCGRCGARIVKSENRQSSQRQTYESGAAAPANNTGDIVLKAAAVIFTIIFGVSAIRSIGAFGSNVSGIFSGWMPGYYLFQSVMCLLAALSSVLICFMLILTAFRRNPDTVDALCLGVFAAAVLRIVVGFLNMVVFMIRNLGDPFIFTRIYIISFLRTLAAAAIAGIVMFVILTYIGELKVLGKEKGAVSGLFEELGDAISDACSRKPHVKGAEASRTQRNINHDLRPAFPLKTDRSIGMYILLSIITCGFYGYYFQYSIARDVNQACEGDGENTSGLIAYILLCFITCGFYGVYWEYKLGNRLAQNGPRYGLQFQENGTSVLVWHLFGGLLCSLGIWVAMHILIKNTNRICQAYNERYGF